jgi:3-hydroxyisobutyrate dehydrogenase-like beta-hydroxyacid dehydrogenase
MKVGFVGVGSMGRPMLEAALEAGHDVTFFARRAEVRDEIEALGASATQSLAALASSAQVVVVCVFTDDQVRDVCMGDEGLLASMATGSVLVIHSTCRPDTAPVLQSLGASRGVRVLDAAFSGGPAEAASGALTLLIGGDEATLDAVRELLVAYANPIIRVGGLGDGQRVKLVNNALFGANVRLVLDAERLASDLGLEPAAAFSAISQCSGNSYALGIANLIGSASMLYEAAGSYITKDTELVATLALESGTSAGLLGEIALRPIP